MAMDLIRKAQSKVQVKSYIETQIKLQNKDQTKAKIQVGALLLDEAFTFVLEKYFNYSNVCFAKNASELLEYIEINNHAIKLERG